MASVKTGGQFCSAAGWNNYRRKCPGLSFFRFPKTQERQVLEILQNVAIGVVRVSILRLFLSSHVTIGRNQLRFKADLLPQIYICFPGCVCVCVCLCVCVRKWVLGSILWANLFHNENVIWFLSCMHLLVRFLGEDFEWSISHSRKAFHQCMVIGED